MPMDQYGALGGRAECNLSPRLTGIRLSSARYCLNENGGVDGQAYAAGGAQQQAFLVVLSDD